VRALRNMHWTMQRVCMWELVLMPLGGESSQRRKEGKVKGSCMGVIFYTNI